MKIQYLPSHGPSPAIHVLTQTEWIEGEVKDIPDDATFRQVIAGVVHYVKWVDDLLSSVNFRLANSDENPNYICSQCGGPALEEGRSDEFVSNGLNQVAAKLFELDGQRVCSTCYDENLNAIPVSEEQSEPEPLLYED